MISITNIHQSVSEVDQYELKINHDIIVRFFHRRSDGLAECLRKAAMAVDAKRQATAQAIMEGLRGE